MKKTIIIFLGPPGSGKGTQTFFFSEKFNIPVISTGQIFRDEVSAGTEIGKIVEEKMNNGELISTEITNQILDKRLKNPDAANGFILDGYPRKGDQVEYAQGEIDKVLVTGGQAFIFYIDVNDEVVSERISGRRLCSCGQSFHLKYNPPKKDNICDVCGKQLIQRKDDTAESVIKRLEVFHEGNDQVLNFLKDKDYFYEINGEQSIEKVREDILNILNN